MPTVLVIDDEPQIRKLLRLVLEEAGCRVHEASGVAEGLSETAARRPDAVILDLGLPDGTGLEVLQRLREWTATPVLVLSAKDSGEDKVEALDAGADDYVTKPFDSGELLARLRAVLRRVQATDEPVFVAGSLKIDFAARRVWCGSSEIDLTSTEYQLLRMLARHAGRVVTHTQLLTSVWGPKASEQSQYLRVHFSHIRKKLGLAGQDIMIRNESGIGYRLLDATARGIDA